MDELLENYPLDIIQISGPSDHGFTPEYYQKGTYTDLWGCVWTNVQPGIIGEVKQHILSDEDKLFAYKPPIDFFHEWWDKAWPSVSNSISVAREKGQFLIGGWISLFERMQFLRGTEDLFCDIASEPINVEHLVCVVAEFYHAYLDKWLACDTDAVAFGDDWGSQRSTLIDPQLFRKLFKPHYLELAKRIKSSGKKLFFHSDGYIFDLYDDIFDLGTDVINTQVWCMGIDKIAAKYAGKVTFWGEMDRQYTMPFGTPEEVRAQAQLL
jgi:uroporphyrinogen decarboxylase